MPEFYQGTPDTALSRLCRTIDQFSPGWSGRCVPAEKEQVRRMAELCAQYGRRLPPVYLDYLRTMGQDDAGLLEQEWDGCMEPSVGHILELLEDNAFGAQEDLERGLLLFSSHWTEAHCYLRLRGSEKDPVVTDSEGEYFAGSFEKYLFQKAFRMYQKQFRCTSSVGTSINSIDEVLERHGFPRSVHGGTREEKTAFIRWLAAPFRPREAWFSDDLHYFAYGDDYALEIDIYWSLSLLFCCNNLSRKKQADTALMKIFGPGAMIPPAPPAR